MGGMARCHGIPGTSGVGVEMVWGKTGGEVGVISGVHSGVTGVTGVLQTDEGREIAVETGGSYHSSHLSPVHSSPGPRMMNSVPLRPTPSVTLCSTSSVTLGTVSSVTLGTASSVTLRAVTLGPAVALRATPTVSLRTVGGYQQLRFWLWLKSVKLSTAHETARGRHQSSRGRWTVFLHREVGFVESGAQRLRGRR